MIKIHDHVVEPTIFPDGTSQVWKLPYEVIEKVKETADGEIVWDFESEAEVFRICQLAELLRSIGQGVYVHVNADFLPYGRQDKPVSNGSTFALSTLFKVLKAAGIEGIETVDAHPPEYNQPDFLYSTWPTDAVFAAIREVGADAICYPDAGAAERYSGLHLEESTRDEKGHIHRHKEKSRTRIVLEKVRNQSTGEITGLGQKVSSVLDVVFLDVKSILIVDDICDGGRTFIEATKLLKRNYPEAYIHLYVSHGIFSKGTDVLFDAGIKTIHTIKGEVKRED